MYLGVDYYPEQWPKEMLDRDLQNIKELNCNIIRIGDFAWDVMEKEEGKYDFSFFDEVIEKAAALGISTMMCVPSATMPRWLNKKYPQIMAQNETGDSQPYGGRRGYCYNNAVYRDKVMKLTAALAKHYQGNKHVVAYQLDNEIGHEGSDMCYCESCRHDFIQWLKGRYDNIEQLNQRWGTSFWAQHYDNFNDIVLPKKAYTAQNPSLRMEWERFRSHSIERYISDMAATFRKENDGLLLHDYEGGTLEKHFDPYETAKSLDDIAYNNYPVWGGLAKPMENYEVAFSLDCARGYKNDNFWITEEIMGAQGHDIIGCSIKPNQGSLWAIQALAHGCKSFLIFRYRGFNKGAEQYCYGIIDADNQNRRKYREVQQLYRFIAQYESLWQSKVDAQACMIYDYDSVAAFRIQRQSDVFNYVGQMVNLYRSLYNRGIMTDVLTKEADLSKYRYVIVPYMIVMDQAFINKLKDYVRNGGICLLTARSSWKDQDNNLVLNENLPLYLTDLCGCIVEEQESLLEGCFRETEKGTATVFADMLKPTTAKTLIKYKNCPFGDYSAVTVNEYGKGKCYLMGAVLDDEQKEELFSEITGQKPKENPQIEIVNRGGKTIEMNFDDFTFNIK